MFPQKISLMPTLKLSKNSNFFQFWEKIMTEDCHHHPVWQSKFVKTLNDHKASPHERFRLASVWSINMVSGSFCFPRYVAALAARAELDAVRYGLIENAWDEAGSYGHTSRSHFWLAVRLAQLLGFSQNEIENIKPLPESELYTDEHYKECAKGNFGFALGMICLIEEFTTPEFTMIFKAFLTSCEVGLDMTQDEFVLKGGAAYFTANIADDERHREEMPQIVATWLKAGGVDIDDPDALTENLRTVREGIRYSANLRLKFFDGIYQFAKDGGDFRDLIGS